MSIPFPTLPTRHGRGLRLWGAALAWLALSGAAHAVLPIEHWHAWLGDATIADAILDRLMQHHHRFTLSGESLRQSKRTPRKEKHDPST